MSRDVRFTAAVSDSIDKLSSFCTTGDDRAFIVMGTDQTRVPSAIVGKRAILTNMLASVFAHEPVFKEIVRKALNTSDQIQATDETEN